MAAVVFLGRTRENRSCGSCCSVFRQKMARTGLVAAVVFSSRTKENRFCGCCIVFRQKMARTDLAAAMVFSERQWREQILYLL